MKKSLGWSMCTQSNELVRNIPTEVHKIYRLEYNILTYTAIREAWGSERFGGDKFGNPMSEREVIFVGKVKAV